MQAIGLRDIKPDPLREERNRLREERIDRENQKRLIEWRISAANLPKKSQRANILECHPDIASWLKSYLAGSACGLVIKGKPGRGKTYSACAILSEVAKSHRVRFATTEDILDEVKSTYSRDARDEREVIEKYVNSRLLCIDDIGKSRPTEWSVPILWKIIDGRDRLDLPTIYTTQYSGDELKERLTIGGDSYTAEAIISRMKSCIQVHLVGVDKRAHVHA